MKKRKSSYSGNSIRKLGNSGNSFIASKDINVHNGYDKYLGQLLHEKQMSEKGLILLGKELENQTYQCEICSRRTADFIKELQKQLKQSRLFMNVFRKHFYDAIDHIENPAVKKKLLASFRKVTSKIWLEV